MNLQKEQLQELTLNTKVYHPFFGDGKIIEIRETSLKVTFKDVTKEFISTGITIGETPIINELYLRPIEIVFK